MKHRGVGILLGAALCMAPVFSGETGRPEPSPEVASGPQTVLRWKARSEQGVYGYLVYRADSEDGRYRRINAEIVHVNSPNPDDPSEYQYVDRDVEAGRTYFYYLDAIGNNGIKSRFSKIISKTVAGP